MVDMTQEEYEAEGIAVEPEEGPPPTPAWVICETCGSTEHEEGQCDSELAAGFASRAWMAHVDHLPPNPEECADAGHCGHVPCCNCSGEKPDPATVAETNAAYQAAGGDVNLCVVCQRLNAPEGKSYCRKCSDALREHPETFA